MKTLRSCPAARTRYGAASPICNASFLHCCTSRGLGGAMTAWARLPPAKSRVILAWPSRRVPPRSSAMTIARCQRRSSLFLGGGIRRGISALYCIVR
jgi:hypothetical protein